MRTPPSTCLALFALVITLAGLGCASPASDDDVGEGQGALSGMPSSPDQLGEGDVDPALLANFRVMKDAYLAARELREVGPPPSDQNYFARIFATHRVFVLRDVPAGMPGPIYVIEWSDQTDGGLLQRALGLSERVRFVSFEQLVSAGAQRKRFGYAVWPATSASGPPRWLTWSRGDHLVEVFKSR